MSKEIVNYLVPVLVMGILFWRLSRQKNGRRVKPSRLWIRPAVIALFLAAALLTTPLPDALGLAIYAASAAAGLGIGYLLARHQTLTLDPETGRITSKMSPVGIALFGGLFMARYVFRMVMTGGQAPDKLAEHSAQIMLYTDAGLFFVLAMVAAQAWEIWRRTRPLLKEHASRQTGSGAE
jgi:hypothetical protein